MPPIDPKLFPDRASADSVTAAFPDRQPEGELFPDVEVAEPENDIDLGESTKFGLFRGLPKQLSNALDFLTRQGEALDPFGPINAIFFPENLERQEKVRKRLQEEFGFGPSAPENIGRLVDVDESKTGKPLTSLKEGLDPERALQVALEQGPGMAVNVAMTLANPTVGTAFIIASEGGETLSNLDALERRTGEKISETEKLVLATAVGGFNGALEKLGIDVVLGNIPGLRSRIARLAISPFSEGVTEGLQEINQIIAENFGEGVFEITEEDLQQIGTAVYGGGVLGLIGGGTSAAVRPGETTTETTGELEDAQIQETEAEGETFDTDSTPQEQIAESEVTQPEAAERGVLEEAAAPKQPVKPETVTEKDQPKSVRSWINKSGLRINTEDLKRFGFNEGSKENRNLILQVGKKDGVSADEAAQQALDEGIIPPPPADTNLTDWFMQKVRDNALTADREQQSIIDEENRHAAIDAPQGEIVDKDSFRQNLTFVSEEQAKAVAEITDARARAWAAQTGKDVSEWYKTRIAGVNVGLSPELADQLKGEVLSQPNEVLFQAVDGGKQVNTPEFKRFFKDSKVVDGEGNPLVMFHGTTNVFTEFTPQPANIENDFGKGFYFSNSPLDISENYAGEGPDFTNRIQLRAERIEQEQEVDEDEALRLAREELSDGAPNIMPVFISLQNPVILGGQNETFIENDSKFDEETDEFIEGERFVEIFEAINNVATEFDDVDAQKVWEDVSEGLLDGVSATEFVQTIKNSEGAEFAFDPETGDLASGEYIRRVFEELGFDGIIDNTVNEKFGNERKLGKQMAGVDSETRHVIAFEPNQIKSAIGNVGTFDPDNPNILQQENKGAVQFLDDGRAIISAFENADVSTAVHELAHIFRRDLDASDQKTVLDWAGKEKWDTEAEEKFARAFEKYLRDGKAPNAKLKAVFDKFKLWLSEIYQSVTGSAIDVDIPPKIKNVFDRLLTPQPVAGEQALTVEAQKRQETAAETPPKTPVKGAQAIDERKRRKRTPGVRSFPETLEEGQLEGGTDRVYEVFADKKAIELAKNRISDNEEAALRFAKDEDLDLNKEQVTIGIFLLNKMREDAKKAKTGSEKENLAFRQVELANSLSRRLTNAGQAIQAASIVARLSPEGLLIYTQKKVNQINKNRKESKQVSITPQDVEKINTISKNIAEAVEIDDSVKDVVDIVKKIGRGDKIDPSELKRMVDLNNKLQREYGDKPKKKKTIKEATIERLDKAEAAAKERLKARGFNLNVGLDPSVLSDFTIIGAAKIGKTGIKFIEWSGKMVEDFGEDIRPHLKRIFGKSVDLWKSEQKRARESRKLQTELNGILRKLEANTDITEVELQTVKSLLEKVENFTGEAREEALYELQGFMRGFEGVTLGRRLATAQTVAQLLNPKTNIRNILGNEMFFRLERMNKYIATGFDWALSNLAGKDRTITFRTAGQKGYWEGLVKGAKAGWEGHNIQNLETQFSLQGQTFESKFNPLTWMEKAMGASLRGFDSAAYNRAYNKFLGEQAELHIINRKLKFKTPEKRKEFIDNYMQSVDANLQEMAAEEGKYITFQDENKVSNTFVQSKRIMNLGKDFGVGDFVMKYPKTPGNLLARAIEYSPIGIARSISILNRPFTDPNFRRREALLALSRAITGTFGLSGLGSILFGIGAISGGEDKDRDLRDFKKQQTGERNFQVNITAIGRFLMGKFNPDLLRKRKDDLLVTYDWAQPVAISIATGADMAKALSENNLDLKTYGDIAYKSLDSALNTLVEQPLVKGVQQAFGSSYGGSILKRVSRILVGVPASFTPTFFSQIAQFTDNDRKITYDPNPLQQALNKVIYKLPFVREGLADVYNTLGGDVAENYRNGSNTLFNVFFNPAFVSKYNIDPELRLLLDPQLAEGRQKQFPKVFPYTIRAAKSTLARFGLKTERAFENIQLKPEDISQLQKTMSEDITKRFKRLPFRELKQLTFEQQEKVMAEQVDQSYISTKVWFFKNLAKNYLQEQE